MLGTQTIATLIAVYGLFMTPLGWGWAAFVWGYALIWFLVNDRVKLLAYRILDPAKSDGTQGKNTSATEQPFARSTNSRMSLPSAKVAPFHTDTDPEDPVYHDNRDCPYGQEIKRNHNDHPGTDRRRRCDWCTEHDSRRRSASR